MIHGELLAKKILSAIVSWQWYDQAKGVVKWVFTNNGSMTGSWVLVRAAEQGGEILENYVFGSAYFPIYSYNASQFGSHFLTSAPTPLIDSGVENNSPPLAVIQTPHGYAVAFVFTLSPGQTWSMLEGGFGGEVEPANPVLADVTYTGVGAQTWCVTYDPEQCGGYNTQSSTNLPCPPNPYRFTSILLQCKQDLPQVFQDKFDPGCASTQ